MRKQGRFKGQSAAHHIRSPASPLLPTRRHLAICAVTMCQPCDALLLQPACSVMTLAVSDCAAAIMLKGQLDRTGSRCKGDHGVGQITSSMRYRTCPQSMQGGWLDFLLPKLAFLAELSRRQDKEHMPDRVTRSALIATMHMTHCKSWWRGGMLTGKNR